MKVLSIGEVLFDLIDGREYIGGAPFNVAAHLAQLGCEAAMLSRIGNDRLGEAALAEMKRLGVDSALAQRDTTHPTGWAKVQLDPAGVPTFGFPEDPAYDFIAVDDRLLERLKQRAFDVVCFGTLAQKGLVTRASLHRLLRARLAPHVFFDVNIRLDFYPQEILTESLACSTIVKLNEEEVPRVAQRLYGRTIAEADLAERWRRDYPVRVVCITKGANGCVVYGPAGGGVLPGIKVNVVDTVGSGDAFSAAFLRNYVRSGDALASARQGNLLGAYVASQAGAVPRYSPEIRHSMGLV